ncbi:MAG: hypothetical protein ACE14P_06280 [Methanotrichaceae archaeon]
MTTESAEWQKIIRATVREKCGDDFEYVIENLSDEILLKMGRAVASTEDAIAYFDDEGHPEFYHNRQALLKAIKKAWAIGADDHKEKLVRYLDIYPNDLREMKRKIQMGNASDICKDLFIIRNI